MGFLKDIIPPVAYQRFSAFYRKLNKNNYIYWEGNYGSWAEASALCKGYDISQILERVKKSSLKVKNGEAAYERDSVLFYRPDYSWELLACILRVASEFNGRLSVLDFGGSLGSTYFQNKKMLSGLGSMNWCIVEQKQFVECGRSEFENEVLKFEYSLEEALAKNKANVLVLASVLQYLANPYEWLQKFCDSKIPYLIIERTPFIQGVNDRLTIQHVPPKIYSTTYPSWFFSEQKFMEIILKYYTMEATYLQHDLSNIPCEFKGFFLKLKTTR